MVSKRTLPLIQKYGGAVPRYTSYPTAPLFHTGFTANDSARCLASLRTGDEISLYIHIPFCHSLCHYCGCHTKIVNHTGVISAYVESLCREVRVAASGMEKGIAASRIHFGGGSPNYAPVEDIRKIIETVRTSFTVPSYSKIDMECDPRLLNEEKIYALSKAGITRVSLGVQDFDEKVQKAINRIQTTTHITKQVQALRHSGIKDINFDLIVGLPEQTRDSIRRTVEETIAIGPERVSVFPYAHVPWMKKHQKLLERFVLPSPWERILWQEDIRTALLGAGYIAIGIDHYAKPEHPLARAQAAGTLRRNFQGYTDDPSRIILGFGISAISQFHDSYAQNTLDAVEYRRAVERAKLPTARGYTLSKADISARTAIMQLMCTYKMNLEDFPEVSVAWGRLTELEKDGIVTWEGTTILITEEGRPFTRVVAACFDRYYQGDFLSKEERHAKAI